MDTLDYFKLVATLPKLEKTGRQEVVFRLMTNFTDDLLGRLLVGKAIAENYYPELLKSGYRQYHLELKNSNSELFKQQPQITFIFFDANSYNRNEFTEGGAFEAVLEDLKKYSESQTGPVVINSFVLPYHTAYGNLTEDSTLFNLVSGYNRRLFDLSKSLKNVHIFDTNRLIHRLGEQKSRDFRSLYAFDLPFTQEFSKELVEEWFAYVYAVTGKAKKCIVLDLDNVLWGGVVGETGPLGIALGPDYPGLAFLNFQRALIDYHDRGVLLAINSKNNEADVDEIFEKNKHMVLQPKHFAAKRINWQDKAANLFELARELNLGLDSFVFLDDDPVNREWVKTRLPQVFVPEFSLEPEEYVAALYSLPVFSPFALTAEDKKKGKMYQQEKQRQAVMSESAGLEDYIEQLNITMDIRENDESAVARLAQMTQKTNQFNLTTRRYSEKQIEDFMKTGKVFHADVTDKFGNYGITVMAIIIFQDGNEAKMDSFLMSCRVLGRGVEQKFFEHITGRLKAVGAKRLLAEFIPTAKNAPAKDFLPSAGFRQAARPDEGRGYILNLV